MILRTNYFIASLWSLQILLLTLVTPAGAIRLIGVKPLFEITAKLNQPSDVAVSKDGRIYVVNGVNNQIRIFNQNGKFLSAFGADGSANGEFKFPLGIDIGRSGKVYIADSGNHRVQIFNSKGSFIAQIRIPPKNNHLADPTDVVVDDTRKRCYVVDNDNHRILVYDLATLKLTNTYGSPGTDKGAFRYPFLMTLDKQKKLYIVDVINTRVQVPDPDGKLVAVIGGWGVEKGEFFRPKGVAIDKSGRVYVSDSYVGVIQVFDAGGTFYAALGDPINGKVKKFKTPAGLFVDHRNRLYVVEMLANKVSVYQIEDEM
jgi:DNA-binding beta-propeller fold protein YncE